jgi:hypothetical protein
MLLVLGQPVILGLIQMVKISKSKTGQFRVTINPQIASIKGENLITQ